MVTLQQLLSTLPQTGVVTWIGVRAARRAPMTSLETVSADPEYGLEGDRYQARSRQRQVTLIQEEHLSVIGSCLGHPPIAPELLRRNMVIRGINLLALKDKTIYIGEVELQITGLCHPCSRMETILGPGGYNAVRGHGGLTARVMTPGQVMLGDCVRI